MAEQKRVWVVTHDSHQLKRGDTFTGSVLPLWLVGKVQEVPQPTFEVATPASSAPVIPTGKPKRTKKEGA